MEKLSNPMLKMRETVLRLMAVSKASEIFPNLESLVIEAHHHVNATQLLDLCKFHSLRSLDIGGHFEENSIIFDALRHCLRLETLRIHCESLTYNDCCFLSEVVPRLTSLCLIPGKSAYSRKGFAELLSSLPCLEIVQSLEGDVFHRLLIIPHLRELEISYATIEDVRSIGVIAVNLEKLVMFDPQYKQPDFFSCMAMLHRCKQLRFIRFSSRVLFHNEFSVSDEVHVFHNVVDVHLLSMVGTDIALPQGVQARLVSMFPAVGEIVTVCGRSYFVSA